MQLKPVENLYLAMDEDGSDVETYTAWTDSDGNIDNTEAYSNGTTLVKIIAAPAGNLTERNGIVT